MTLLVVHHGGVCSGVCSGGTPREYQYHDPSLHDVYTFGGSCVVGSGFPECLSFFIGLQTHLTFAESFTLTPKVEGQKCIMENFSVKFSGCLQLSYKGWEKNAKKFTINLHTLNI